MATSSASRTPERVFAALLKYWRGARGLSQLDLALTAEVSARHISFLETGRSQPSVEMVLLLAESLDVPLRDRNELLRAAGFGAQYAEPGIDEALNGILGTALTTMLEHHEPFPLIVIDHHYQVVRVNRAGAKMLALAGQPEATEINLLRLMFEPTVRELVADWEESAGSLLRRLQRETLQRPQDEALQTLLADLLAAPGVPEAWRQPNPSQPSDPLLALKLRLGDQVLSFLTTVTTFNAPHNVTLDELHIESWFPMDDATAQACHELLG